MAAIETLFVTRIYRAELADAAGKKLRTELDHACRMTAEEDAAGQRWCREHGYRGYTSYASLGDLTIRSPTFADLEGVLDTHVGQFARTLDLDLGRRRLKLDSIWINVLAPGGHHAGHIHPHSVVSGTFYVAIPGGARGLKFEDPRLPMMMAAPPRKTRARRDQATFVTFEPKPGTLLLWESWLRHEVPVNDSADDRVSVSFNYAWD